MRIGACFFSYNMITLDIKNSMNLTEPDASFENLLVTAQHICGVAMLIFNGSITLLIILDDDIRNKHYRKYLCCVQISSIALDTFSDFYAPIFLVQWGLVYSDSFLSHFVSIGIFCVVELILLAEVILCYFACVYYRRSIVIGPEKLFNFRGSRRFLFLLFVNIYGLIGIAGMVFFARKSVLIAEDIPHPHLDWVKSRTSYLFVNPDDENMRYAGYFVTLIAYSILIPMVAMLVQLVSEVKKGQRRASIATRRQATYFRKKILFWKKCNGYFRYQHLAVRSLILQGAVPTLVYLIPSFGTNIIHFAPTVIDCGEVFNRIATVISPINWVIMTKHTFASSLTILYCSPSYRRKIVMIITRSNNRVVPVEVTRESDSKL